MTRILIKDSLNHKDESITISGWIDTRRDHGKIVFLDIRDRTGLIQVVARPEQIEGLHGEDVVTITGHVKSRPERLINPKLATGTIEMEASSVELLAKSEALPFPIDSEGYEIDEEIRLKYRYVDLRRSRLANNIRLRSQLVREAREFLYGEDFVEIETPMLTKSTPEGSRDFIVPSRIRPGEFYALPQSPQQYKQLLMTAGFERYFQIARCLRDEDLRADRGFEHSQIDIEMSFANREDVMSLLERLITTIFEKMGKKIKQKPFPIYTYQEAMKQFGADKFDLRTEEEKKEGICAFAWVVDFPFFEKDKEDKWTFTHNPFSNPKKEYLEDLKNKKNIESILTSQYDLVCNGYEAGGGSIRAHDPEVLTAVFEVMGYSKDQIESQFGHMLKAFSLGTPPHGGCAFGIERLVMLITGEAYLREVVAFPMTSGGQTSVMDAPSIVDPKQLSEVGLSVKKKS